MSIRTPLVLSSTGQIEQLQPGDSIANPITNNYVADAALSPGCPVYASAAGHINAAEANALTTSKLVGMTTAAVASGASGPIQADGILSLTTAQWNAVTGGTTGLTYGAIYFLSDASAGQLTTTPPSTQGHFLVPVGIAISTTDMQLYNNGTIIGL
jgi:hypothetical protein